MSIRRNNWLILTFISSCRRTRSGSHPVLSSKAKDPISSLTVPELLAAAELVLEDLVQLIEEYVPGGHLLTVKQWKQLSRLLRVIKRSRMWHGHFCDLLSSLCFKTLSDIESCQ